MWDIKGFRAKRSGDGEVAKFEILWPLEILVRSG